MNYIIIIKNKELINLNFNKKAYNALFLAVKNQEDIATTREKVITQKN